MRLKLVLIAMLSFGVTLSMAQSQFSGDLETNVQFYQLDSSIGAFGTPHYDNLKNGGDSWLSMKYDNLDFNLSAGIRMDFFYNSNLHDPGSAYSGLGVGMFYVSKQIHNLHITGGHIYDQFGSGITFRAYEERSLGIDKSLFGVRLKYDFNDNWFIKALVGKQKNLFELYEPIVMGSNVEGYIPIGNNVQIIPGVSIMNRTMDEESIQLLKDNIEQLPVDQRFVPKYNVYSWSAYTTLNFKSITWYGEYAGKTHEAIKDDKNTIVDADGYFVQTNVTYTRKGFGITGQFRRLENFILKTSPDEILLDGVLNYNPSFSKQNSLRLPARYGAVAQDLGEQAFQVDVIYTPVKGYTLSANYSDISDLDGNQLFREAYLDVEIKKKREWKLMLGGQFLQYNQEVYEQKPNADLVEAITPFTEFTYKINRKHSLRAEAQYQYTKQDFGSWLFGLLEYNMAPNLSVSVSDLWNFKPKKAPVGVEPSDPDNFKKIHYFNVAASYTHKANRFALSYGKQPEGIICTGGICRFEPAFSGVKLAVTSSF